ncbi:hypothetical protein VNO78_35043 [Psophocarpus tetragonolobus]|uniref:Uncharacterized protein n=1 Tax=Psophocarpus tetragonolobus TaxID=3891 RepID=A0AAN9NSB9_PSOTE
MASGATCVQRLDGSRDSAIHTKYRIRYVLHRCKSRDIRCRESFCIMCRDNTHRTPSPGPQESPFTVSISLAHKAPGFVLNRPLQFQFPWHTKRRGSPTETLLRLLLPLNDKVQWTSHNVAGSEPPTSPQSEHFTGPFNR